MDGRQETLRYVLMAHMGNISEVKAAFPFQEKIKSRDHDIYHLRKRVED